MSISLMSYSKKTKNRKEEAGEVRLEAVSWDFTKIPRFVFTPWPHPLMALCYDYLKCLVCKKSKGPFIKDVINRGGGGFAKR